jgi:hypothetical protein
VVQSRLTSPYIVHNGGVIWTTYSRRCWIALTECYGSMMTKSLNSMHIGMTTHITLGLN